MVQLMKSILQKEKKRPRWGHALSLVLVHTLSPLTEKITEAQKLHGVKEPRPRQSGSRADSLYSCTLLPGGWSVGMGRHCGHSRR